MEEPIAVTLSESGPRSGRLRMLVADDSPVARHSISGFLRGLDHVELCAICENGRTAVETALVDPPAVVLLDLQMPVMSGLEAAGILRSCLPETGVILMTIHDHPGVRAACLAGGADAFVPKARLARQFEAALDQALSAARARSRAVAHPQVEASLSPYALSKHLDSSR